MVAKAVCVIGIIASVIGAIVLFANAAEYSFLAHLWVVGLAVLTFGSLIFWAASLVLYGFGELIENTAVIAYNTSLSNNK